MKQILVCTIVRNQEANLDIWYKQLVELHNECPDWQFSVSVYENDSTDRTKEMLKDYQDIYPRLLFFVRSDDLGTKQYGSIWSIDRLRNLAAYRNNCLSGFDLRTYDKIAYIEPDVTYDPKWCKELILAEHPRRAGFNPDIYSGWSLRSLSHPKESTFLYDTCATRQGPNENCWDFAAAHEYNDLSLIKTHISNIDSNCLHTAWSTFNCFCVYNAKPFVDGLRWGYVNHRFNPGQQYIDDGDIGSGWLDADTVVMCERFRAMGHERIVYNTNCLIRHS